MAFIEFKVELASLVEQASRIADALDRLAPIPKIPAKPSRKLTDRDIIMTDEEARWRQERQEHQEME